jgi:parallel beta-helix repeat protein
VYISDPAIRENPPSHARGYPVGRRWGLGWFGGSGIVTGDRASIDRVNVRSNGNAGAAGISVGPVSMVTESVAHGNSGDGIFAGAASTVRGNRAVGNGQAGIHVLSGSVVSGNTANGNQGYGLFIGEGSVVSENAVSFNANIGILTDAACSVLQNSVISNQAFGIDAGSASVVANNVVSANAYVGIRFGNGARGGLVIANSVARNGQVSAPWSGIGIADGA